MGQTRPAKPVMLMTAISSSYPAAIDWAIEELPKHFGPIGLVGERFLFDQTRFYQSTMGNRIEKQMVAFEQLIDPADLADVKNQTNCLEQTYIDSHDHPCSRSINLDPGYVTEAKLVLATVKNRDHRIYLRDGIYAEVTLSYHNKQWNSSRWTYPDYLLDQNIEFLTNCRDQLRKKIHSES
ncbi:MAG: DUF4416 family protein [Planctomycetota bacterium]